MATKKPKITFNAGDLVFAKVRGYPYWPARISSLADEKGHRFHVFFYGTYETAVCKKEDLLHFNAEVKEKFGKAQARKGFTEGLYEIENTPDIALPVNDTFIVAGPKQTTSDSNVEATQVSVSEKVVKNRKRKLEDTKLEEVSTPETAPAAKRSKKSEVATPATDKPETPAAVKKGLTGKSGTPSTAKKQTKSKAETPGESKQNLSNQGDTPGTSKKSVLVKGETPLSSKKSAAIKGKEKPIDSEAEKPEALKTSKRKGSEALAAPLPFESSQPEVAGGTEKTEPVNSRRKSAVLKKGANVDSSSSSEKSKPSKPVDADQSLSQSEVLEPGHVDKDESASAAKTSKRTTKAASSMPTSTTAKKSQTVTNITESFTLPTPISTPAKESTDSPMDVEKTSRSGRKIKQKKFDDETVSTSGTPRKPYIQPSGKVQKMPKKIWVQVPSTGDVAEIYLDQNRPSQFSNKAAEQAWDASAIDQAVQLVKHIQSGLFVPEEIRAKTAKEAENVGLSSKQQKEKLVFMRQEKVRWLKLEQRLVEVEHELKKALQIEKPDMSKAMDLLTEMHKITVGSVLIKKQPQVVDTLRKLRKYVGPKDLSDASLKDLAKKIRMKADSIFVKILSSFAMPDESGQMESLFADKIDVAKNFELLSKQIEADSKQTANRRRTK